MRSVNRIEVNIASGQAVSDAVSVFGQSVVGLEIPAEWTAAGIAFQSSHDGATFYPVYRENGSQEQAEYEILAAQVPTAEAVILPLDPVVFLHAQHLKIVSQTSGVAVNQGDDRTLWVLARDLGE